MIGPIISLPGLKKEEEKDKQFLTLQMFLIKMMKFLFILVLLVL